MIDISVPHSARIWNYWLGGQDHYEVDRAAGERYRTAFPGITLLARASRGFLTRAVHHLVAEAGIRQFVDIGTGLPTADNTHQIAQRVAPEARIVYVDNDALVLAHARALLISGPSGVTDYVHADLHEPAVILEAMARTLDLTRPVGLILSGVLGHIASHEEARAIVARLLEALPSGSHLALSDGTNVFAKACVAAQQEYNESGAVPYHLRSPEELAVFFDGLDLIEPGFVPCSRWRPGTREPEPGEELDIFGGVGRKS
ncbi:SAM-dependent methyltransferase [Streptomyces avicenniae]|uniref:SAM-dependent methyltransferase n=1 Tax=Streptomyces avicenniae TaxID=500153 RepID=UPI00069B4017|nr:SAM-dependent methyltransferase [Streptomyces avicenniae]